MKYSIICLKTLDPILYIQVKTYEVEKIRLSFRLACTGRRTLMLDLPHLYAANLIRQLVSRFYDSVEIFTEKPTLNRHKADYRSYTLEWKKNTLMIISRDTYDPEAIEQPFFQFIGRENTRKVPRLDEAISHRARTQERKAFELSLMQTKPVMTEEHYHLRDVILKERKRKGARIEPPDFTGLKGPTHPVNQDPEPGTPEWDALVAKEQAIPWPHYIPPEPTPVEEGSSPRKPRKLLKGI